MGSRDGAAWWVLRQEAELTVKGRGEIWIEENCKIWMGWDGKGKEREGKGFEGKRKERRDENEMR